MSRQYCLACSRRKFKQAKLRSAMPLQPQPFNPKSPRPHTGHLSAVREDGPQKGKRTQDQDRLDVQPSHGSWGARSGATIAPQLDPFGPMIGTSHAVSITTPPEPRTKLTDSTQASLHGVHQRDCNRDQSYAHRVRAPENLQDRP